MSFLNFRRALIGAALSLPFAITHAADGPLRVIIPASAGSGVDVQVRAAGPSLTRAMGGRALVIENLPGAGGLTGTSAIVKAAADGNTIGIVSNNHAVNPSVFKKMPYDSLADITPVTVIGETPFVLVVNPAKVAAKTAKELQAFLKAKPGAYNYASGGNGTILHLAGAMVNDAMDVEVRHIPYRGVGPMIADLIGGQVEMGVLAVPAVQAHLKSGALRAIGVTGKQRVPAMPDLPTMAEQGFADVDVGGWFAVIAPAKLPAAEVSKLHAAVVAAFNDPETKAAMDKQQNIIRPSTPEAAAQFFRSEIERYGKLVKKIALKVE